MTKHARLIFCVVLIGTAVMSRLFHSIVDISDAELSLRGGVSDTDIGSTSTIEEQAHAHAAESDERSSIVIAMGVCCDLSAQKATQAEQPKHRHQAKPYAQAAVLATRLWKAQAADMTIMMAANARPNAQVEVEVKIDLKVLVLLAYTESSKEELQLYTGWIERAGGIVWPYDVSAYKDPATACIRAAQMGRLFAATDHSSIVSDSDYVITSDVDVFPVNATQLLAPIFARNPADNNNYYRIWMSQYEWAVTKKKTIPMAFIGQSARDWKRGLEKTGDQPQRLGLDLPTAIALSLQVALGNYPWGCDQIIGTASIINSQLCDFPDTYLEYWKTEHTVAGLVPQETLDTMTNRNLEQSDSDNAILPVLSCLKDNAGFSEKQCLTTPDDSCTWVHFFPTVSLQQLQAAYDAIAAKYSNHVAASQLLL
jgi:hypothetical protein